MVCSIISYHIIYDDGGVPGGGARWGHAINQVGKNKFHSFQQPDHPQFKNNKVISNYKFV